MVNRYVWPTPLKPEHRLSSREWKGLEQGRSSLEARRHTDRTADRAQIGSGQKAGTHDQLRLNAWTIIPTSERTTVMPRLAAPGHLERRDYCAVRNVFPGETSRT